MDVALWCTECGTRAAGTRFCTACGAVLPERQPMAAPLTPDAPPAAVIAAATTQVLAPTHTLTAELPVAVPPIAARGRTAANILAVLVVVALALSAWALMHGAERHILSGTVLLVDSAYDDYSPGTYCTGDAGYSDIGAGT